MFCQEVYKLRSAAVLSNSKFQLPRHFSFIELTLVAGSNKMESDRLIELSDEIINHKFCGMPKFLRRRISQILC
jgi:hypothetical protein